MDYSPKSAASMLNKQCASDMPARANDTPKHVDKVPSPGMMSNPKAAASALKAQDKDCPC